MRFSTILMSILALAIAMAAGYSAQTWLDQQRRVAQPAAPTTTRQEVRMAKIVVATTPMRFGVELTDANTREIDWPAASLPTGAFAAKSELIKPGERRVVLSPIEANEPVLRTKITGPGQRASLSALIDPGMKAITIRVNDVLGVAGFVLPGDRVDVVLTRTEEEDAPPRLQQHGRAAQTEKIKRTFTDVMLQHVRVLGVDQLADERTDKATVVKAVTLEVDTADAQKLVLASSVATLSLILRPAGSNTTTKVARVDTDDLGPQRPRVVAQAMSEPIAMAPVPVAAPPRIERRRDTATVFVTRGVATARSEVLPDREMHW